MAAPNAPLSIGLGTEACRLLSDASRVRLLLLLESLSLSAAELTEITGLAQSRVSTHLSRLKNAGLVADERTNGAALYSATAAAQGAAGAIWNLLRPQLDDAQARLDRERAGEVIRQRHRDQTWAESVAGRMELHYSPGRSWEATARALMMLLELGDVLDLASGDGVVAELLSPHARRVTCVDVSAAVLSAAQRRLAQRTNVSFHQGDMHQLPFEDASFDHVFALHALSYSHEPQRAIREATRVLRPGGRLVIAALKRHEHAETQRAFDHLNLGIELDHLRNLMNKAGLNVAECAVSSRETRPPYFEVIGALGVK
ncbi:methyltransferase domain-containing protein [Panacagrimonas sp.]|uniref:methyltransferase domain-containing protein n=1 Tax=Panacagrimonas sp. TaxID=2480088 RepID=UPI003B52C440